MKPVQLLASALAVSTFTSAWPWPPSLGDIKAIAQENGLYQKRQDNGGGNGGGDNQGGNNDDNNTSAPVSSARPTDSQSATDSASNTDASNTASNTDSNSDSNTSGSDAPKPTNSDSDSDLNSNSTSVTSSAYTNSISAGAQPGGVNFIQPNTQSTATQYYKVDQTITWIWNYTSLSRPPSAIDIVATVSGGTSAGAPSPFTLATNMSFAPTETFTWDTGEYVNNTSALPVGTYTLMIYDAGNAAGVSATASAGYLAAYNQFRFGMYTGQPATSLARPFMCATCNGAQGRMGSEVLWVVIGTASLVTASFVWFAGGWGVL